MAEAKRPVKESSKARAACEEYLLMGPERSLAKLCSAMKRPPGYERTLKEWSKVFDWVAKAKEYDKEQATKRRREIEAEREEIDKEHLLLGRAQALTAVQMIEDLLKKGKYGLQAAVQLLKVATDLQRLAIGSATAQVAITGKDGGPVDLDVEVTTHWGRNTDPRRKHTEPSAIDETTEEDQDQGDEDEEFGIDIPDDDE